MQNIPIIANLPTPPAPVQAATDNGNATPPAESFNSVLARQRSGVNAPGTSQQGDKPSASSVSATKAPASGKDIAPASGSETPVATSLATDTTIATQPIDTPVLPYPVGMGGAPIGNTPVGNNKEKTVAPLATADAAGTLPTDATALPLPAATGGKATGDTTLTVSSTSTSNKKEKAAADTASTLPSDMLAMMLPAASIATSVATPVATGGKSAPDPLTAASKQPQALPITKAAPVEPLQVAANQGAVSGADPAQGQAFSAVLGAKNQDGINAVPADGGTAKTLAAHVLSNAPDNMLPSSVAPISFSNSGHAPTVAQAAVNAPLAHDAWGSELGQKIVWMASKNEQIAQLHLNPPNLGPLNVVLKVSGDQATALFTSPHAAVRDAVTQAMPQLRDTLANNGITLGNATVSDQSPKDQPAWQAQQKGGTHAASATTAATDSIAPGAAASITRRHLGMVDTFA